MTLQELKDNREEIIKILTEKVGAENVKNAMIIMTSEAHNFDEIEFLIDDTVYQINRSQRKPDSKRTTILARLAEMED